MIIKKFEGTTENEAIMKAKEELGSGAIVMNIKTIKPKGLFRAFRKTTVEVMAAMDEKGDKTILQTPDTSAALSNVPSSVVAEAITSNRTKTETKTEAVASKKSKTEAMKAPSAIEQKLDKLADMLEKQVLTEKQEAQLVAEAPRKSENTTKAETENNKIRNLLMNQLLNNEVNEEYAVMLVDELENFPQKEEALDSILSKVYQRIVLKLGQPEVISLEQDKKPRVCFFVGSTGVGKTTTIAKIASMFKLDKKAKVALITSDTYRIAAVEQLKTYANILSLPIRVVYTPEEMKQAVKDYEKYDLIIVDTAGRSPKNQEQCDELRLLLDSVQPELREVYLVLSATTKYKDMQQIVKRYDDIAEYRLLFTKLDETSCYGNILNIRMATDAPLSYVTCGQVVPDDISTINAQTIAKQLIGGCE